MLNIFYNLLSGLRKTEQSTNLIEGDESVTDEWIIVEKKDEICEGNKENQLQKYEKTQVDGCLRNTAGKEKKKLKSCSQCDTITKKENVKNQLPLGVTHKNYILKRRAKAKQTNVLRNQEPNMEKVLFPATSLIPSQNIKPKIQSTQSLNKPRHLKKLNKIMKYQNSRRQQRKDKMRSPSGVNNNRKC